ncbi:SOS response-associated peptidase [Methylovulum miyakonense]|uniref:SOS response-associated peptidase n=1 Tax=Methylovulum miyakonense TaxID=645578 RepID=UPI00037161EB|nr:SOS response-associated peptidase [Methylovulum miyakonense]
MCGRFYLIAKPDDIIGHFHLQKLPSYQPSYNITPAQKILTIVGLEDSSLKAVNLFWGLVPSWSKDSKNSHHLINARAETVSEKPSFRAAFHKRRCLVVASGFYEWAKTESGKQAFNIHRQDKQPFAFAGLWEHWEHEQGTLYSCTIITAQATGIMQPIHERMPVVISPDHYRPWLDKATDGQHALPLLNNEAYAQMLATPVSDWVNNPRHDDERCLQ